ncbi:MAG TPA: hypothetical protein VI485_12195 [Vicinamibacterales bacterium]|nr:hypothetical protein [Vicinamibacterales bacterium]
MPDLVAVAKSAQEIDTAVGLVAKLIGKLKAQPDIAALKLGRRWTKSRRRFRPSMPPPLRI